MKKRSTSRTPASTPPPPPHCAQPHPWSTWWRHVSYISPARSPRTTPLRRPPGALRLAMRRRRNNNRIASSTAIWPCSFGALAFALMSSECLWVLTLLLLGPVESFQLPTPCWSVTYPISSLSTSSGSSAWREYLPRQKHSHHRAVPPFPPPIPIPNSIHNSVFVFRLRSFAKLCVRPSAGRHTRHLVFVRAHPRGGGGVAYHGGVLLRHLHALRQGAGGRPLPLPRTLLSPALSDNPQ